jgi:hypothetical protein
MPKFRATRCLALDAWRNVSVNFLGRGRFQGAGSGLQRFRGRVIVER